MPQINIWVFYYCSSLLLIVKFFLEFIGKTFCGRFFFFFQNEKLICNAVLTPKVHARNLQEWKFARICFSVFSKMALLIKCQCCHHKETSQLICNKSIDRVSIWWQHWRLSHFRPMFHLRINQVVGFYISEALVKNMLMS